MSVPVATNRLLAMLPKTKRTDVFSPGDKSTLVFGETLNRAW